jgi:S1-C subfamily serine protease
VAWEEWQHAAPPAAEPEHTRPAEGEPEPARPPASPRAGRRALLSFLAALMVLVAVGIGIGIGYAAFHSTPYARISSPSSTPPSRPSSTPAVRPTPISPDVAAVAAKVDPGVVDIDTTLSYQTASGAGTGMVVTPSGEVLTNNHVIEGETSLHVTDVGNGKTYSATVLGYDVSADVAVLQITGASRLHTVSFARAPVKIGQAVVAIGNAGGKGGTPSAVSGTVTRLDQSITAQDALSGSVEHLTGMIETDAPIQAGDSGGPLVDTAGQVVGMDTAGSSHFAFAQQTTQGFAIPIGTARAIAAQINRGQASSNVHIGPTAFLGVEVTDVGTTGAVVVRVLPGTTATAIGLAPGDTIVSFGNRTIRSPTTLSEVLQVEPPGVTVAIGWQNRFGQSAAATITLGSGPPA